MDEFSYKVEDFSEVNEPVICGGGCGWEGKQDDGANIEGCSLTPGDGSPACRCPECDSLAYPRSMHDESIGVQFGHVFRRSGEPDTQAVLTYRSLKGVSPEALVDAITAAVTACVGEPDFKRALDYAGDDLNIGDLLSFDLMDNARFVDELRKRGIYSLKALAVSVESTSYDRVLVAPEALAESA